VGRRDVPGPSTDFSVTDGLWWIGNHNSVTRSISQNGDAEQTQKRVMGAGASVCGE